MVHCVCRENFVQGSDGKCHQLFTSAYCQDENKVNKLYWSPCDYSPTGQMVVEDVSGGARCVNSPCLPGQLPHYSTWPKPWSPVNSLADIRCFPASAEVSFCSGMVNLHGSQLRHGLLYRNEF